MEEKKNISAEGEPVTPEAPVAESPVADAPAPDLNTGPAAPQEQEGITPTDPGDVVVSFDKIEELKIKHFFLCEAPQRILCKRFSTKSRISRFQCAG